MARSRGSGRVPLFDHEPGGDPFAMAHLDATSICGVMNVGWVGTWYSGSVRIGQVGFIITDFFFLGLLTRTRTTQPTDAIFPFISLRSFFLSFSSYSHSILPTCATAITTRKLDSGLNLRSLSSFFGSCFLCFYSLFSNGVWGGLPGLVLPSYLLFAFCRYYSLLYLLSHFLCDLFYYQFPSILVQHFASMTPFFFSSRLAS